MTVRKKKLNRILHSVFASFLVLAVLFVVSCDNGNDDPPEPELYDLSGVYTFKEAILQTSLEIPGIPIPIPAPRDITEEMAGGLLENANCTDPNNGAVELKSDKSLYFTCLTEDTEIPAGTWDVNSDTTTLTLSLSVPAPLALVLEELKIDETNDVIGGTIKNFPITKDLLAGFLSEYPKETADAILAGIPEDFVQIVAVDIEFQKVTQ